MGQNRANREQGRWKGQDLLKVWGEGVRSLQDGPGQLQKDWGGGPSCDGDNFRCKWMVVMDVQQCRYTKCIKITFKDS